MNIIIERYYGYGKAYLIWDPMKNNMSLDSDKIKYIKRNNLFLNECEILYGPIGGKDSTEFLSYDKYGIPCKKTIQNIGVFRKYMEDKTYNNGEKGAIRSIGFIILNYNFVEELEGRRYIEYSITKKRGKKAI